jgi:hypothetical protein
MMANDGATPVVGAVNLASGGSKRFDNSGTNPAPGCPEVASNVAKGGAKSGTQSATRGPDPRPGASKSFDNSASPAAADYAEHVKSSDAIATPDGALWIAEELAGDQVKVVSAFRDSQGRIRQDVVDAKHTQLLIAFAQKAADAREVAGP